MCSSDLVTAPVSRPKYQFHLRMNMDMALLWVIVGGLLEPVWVIGLKKYNDTRNLLWGAFAVIIMIIQVAGSGGTFPIELVPEFFRKVYRLLPFTHAMNAMREVIAGPYQNNYWMDLLKLCAHIPVALLLGLALRKPFIRMNRFLEERLKDTHLM